MATLCRRQLPATFNFALDVVDRWAAEPGKLALIAENAAGASESFTFEDISRKSSQLANLLWEQGIRQGDRVIVLLPRIPQWQIGMVALLRMGAIPIPCITMLTPSDLAYRAEHSGATGIITTRAECHKLDGIPGLATRICVGDAPHGWTCIAAADDQPAGHAAAEVAINDPAIIYYTSGSTGSPKGVTHASRAL